MSEFIRVQITSECYDTLRLDCQRRQTSISNHVRSLIEDDIELRLGLKLTQKIGGRGLPAGQTYSPAERGLLASGISRLEINQTPQTPQFETDPLTFEVLPGGQLDALRAGLSKWLSLTKGPTWPALIDPSSMFSRWDHQLLVNVLKDMGWLIDEHGQLTRAQTP